MSDVGLGLRLIRGGGRQGLTRIILMAVGLALGVAVALTVATMPTVLSERGRIVSVRTPLSVVDRTAHRFDSRVVRGVWNDSRVTRVLVANVSGAPLPPGVSQLPQPGETVLSPAARSLMSRDSGFAALLPGNVIGTIADSGLTGPDELYAYVGVAGDTSGLAPSRGWGVPVSTRRLASSSPRFHGNWPW